MLFSSYLKASDSAKNSDDRSIASVKTDQMHSIVTQHPAGCCAAFCVSECNC